VAQTPDQGWLAVGWSHTGPMVSTLTFPSDAVLVWADQNGLPNATDFQMTDRTPPDEGKCLNKTAGSCPDYTQGCTDNVSQLRASRQNGYLVAEFVRPLAASDVCDIEIKPGTPQFLIFAVGPVTGSFFLAVQGAVPQFTHKRHLFNHICGSSCCFFDKSLPHCLPWLSMQCWWSLQPRKCMFSRPLPTFLRNHPSFFTSSLLSLLWTWYDHKSCHASQSQCQWRLVSLVPGRPSGLY